MTNLHTVIPVVAEAGRLRTLDEIKGDAVRAALFYSDGNVSQAVRSLKIGRGTFYRYCERHGIDPKQYKHRTAK